MRPLPLIALVALGACASRGPAVLVAEGPTDRALVREASAEPATGSLWNQAPESLFGNRRARTVGDILTVIVQIDEEAEIGNEVDRSRSNEEQFRIGALFGLPNAAQTVLPQNATLDPAVDFSRERAFSGSGNLRREDRITLQLAARVTEKLPNGYLIIRGEQRVRVNDEVRLLRASGVIRPEDISRNNTITHEKIAEADIGYVGRGSFDRTTNDRSGNRVLDWVIPF